jgi:putative transcriptional regulator
MADPFVVPCHPFAVPLACAGQQNPLLARLPQERKERSYLLSTQSLENHYRKRIPKNDQLFEHLVSSLQESGAILRGKKKASRQKTLQWPEARVVREKLGLTQPQFAAMIGISIRTLQNWEQGHRRPEGTARALLRVAERHPEAVLESLHA